jgi:hypothetical protein
LGQADLRGVMRWGGMGTLRDCMRMADGEESGLAGGKRGRPSESICIAVSSGCVWEGDERDVGCRRVVISISCRSLSSSAVVGSGMSAAAAVSEARASG